MEGVLCVYGYIVYRKCAVCGGCGGKCAVCGGCGGKCAVCGGYVVGSVLCVVQLWGECMMCVVALCGER